MADDKVQSGESGRLRIVHDHSGTGHVIVVVLDEVTVWMHAYHIDGPLSPDARALLSALDPPENKVPFGGSGTGGV